MLRCYLITLSLCAPLAAGAHPHEFIDTSLVLHFDAAGQIATVDVRWVWDDFTSMLMLADQGMDPDADGALTAAEADAMAARLSLWPDDFLGDLYFTADGQPVGLQSPQDVAIDYQDGRLIMSYWRALAVPLQPDAGVITVQAYDPTYYAFYDLAGPPELQGRADCDVAVAQADLNAAQQLYDQLLSELTEEDIADFGMYPEVGGAFADMVNVTCAPLQ